ncbi:PEPxxWA-CTERM sorting domain-containing protein [Phenylobacterium sp.]|uniref:PEPxxWA-CTERM sorting domain-containing protein n=1 Tax=Phenylobacterium sp. TaxID=1871053 RepID=UPI0025FC7AA8|nr:PEPxxWA-CTERM sorting domain-containing protein [Phenylobacterium sp.]
MIALASSALAVVLAATPSMAAVTTYAGQVDFEAAAGPTTLFDFNATPDGSFEGTSYDVGPFTLTGDPTNGVGGMGVASGEAYGDVCGLCALPYGYVITFDTAITAFGASYRNVLSGSGIRFTVNGDTFAGPAVNDGFFGFTSTTAFTTITVSGDNEFHFFDDVRYASASAGVPEPSTWAMLILGFAGVGAALRRRAWATPA